MFKGGNAKNRLTSLPKTSKKLRISNGNDILLKPVKLKQDLCRTISDVFKRYGLKNWNKLTYSLNKEVKSRFKEIPITTSIDITSQKFFGMSFKSLYGLDEVSFSGRCHNSRYN
jgi:hypothetical protein